VKTELVTKAGADAVNGEPGPAKLSSTNPAP